MSEESFLQVADRITETDRFSTHGNFNNNCEIAINIFKAWTGISLKKEDVPKLLIALKMARMQSNPSYTDNFTDIAGYLKLLYKMDVMQDEPEVMQDLPF